MMCTGLSFQLINVRENGNINFATIFLKQYLRVHELCCQQTDKHKEFNNHLGITDNRDTTE